MNALPPQLPGAAIARLGLAAFAVAELTIAISAVAFGVSLVVVAAAVLGLFLAYEADRGVRWAWVAVIIFALTPVIAGLPVFLSDLSALRPVELLVLTVLVAANLFAIYAIGISPAGRGYFVARQARDRADSRTP